LPSYRAWLDANCRGDDPLFFAVIANTDGRPAGVVSYLRITPASGSIEVGHIHYSPHLQRSPAATEAMYLMMKWAFESGYRRYEWKCDALNAASRGAAQRLGLSFEGVFRQATVYRGRNRDTAWYAAVDAEWPALRDAFQAWLDLRNPRVGEVRFIVLSTPQLVKLAPLFVVGQRQACIVGEVCMFAAKPNKGL
jgi:RimJ/RimL family protein N-acetyltransferase